MNKQEAYQIVFDDLCERPMFTGKYDAMNGNESFMYGICTVMENIAQGISDECHDRFEDEFLQHMLEIEGWNDSSKDNDIR